MQRNRRKSAKEKKYTQPLPEPELHFPSKDKHLKSFKVYKILLKSWDFSWKRGNDKNGKMMSAI